MLRHKLRVCSTCLGVVTQFADVVVSVARKMDAALWPALFAAVGSPSALLEGLAQRGALTSAACCLLVVDCLEGSASAQRLTISLLQVRAVSNPDSEHQQPVSVRCWRRMNASTTPMP